MLPHDDLIMKYKTPFALTALATSGLLAFALPADEVTFAPSEGTSITKTFTSESVFALDDMEMTMGGQSPPGMPEMEMEMTLESSIQVTDEYASVDGGQVLELVRSFDTVGQEMSMEMSLEVAGESHPQDGSGSGSSSLEGTAVRFTWDADDEAYVPAFEGDDGDEDLLEGLVEDMDLRTLLPDGPVSEGDEWDVELVALADILAPGGNLAVDVEMDGQAGLGGGPDPQMISNMRELLADLLEGDFTATYQGTKEVDGITVGVIALAVEIESARDMSEMMEEGMSESEMPFEVELTRADAEFTFEGEGTMLWNLAGGHIHSFDLSGDTSIAMDMAMAIPGQGIEMETSMEMSGTMTQTVRTEGTN